MIREAFSICSFLDWWVGIARLRFDESNAGSVEWRRGMIDSRYHYVGPKAKARGSQPHFIEGSDLVLSRGHALEDHVRGGGFLMTVII